MRKEGLSEAVLRLAHQVQKALETDHVAVDLLPLPEGGHAIIEVSLFTNALSSEQLVVDGVPGWYRRVGDAYRFEAGRVWIQELMLKWAMERWLASRGEKGETDG